MTLHRLMFSLALALPSFVAQAGEFVPAAEGAVSAPSRYIVQLQAEAGGKPAATTAADTLLAIYGGRLIRAYGTALMGFAATMTEAQAVALATDPTVKVVSPDTVLRLAGTQFSPPWGLDRVDQRTLPLSQTYIYADGGTTAHVYVLDSGLAADHPDFVGRVGTGYNAVPDLGLVLGETIDCNGHGTHVAGTAVGATHGVAKRAIVHPVRISSCAPTTLSSLAIDGIDWVASHAQRPAVANYSLSGGVDALLEQALRNLIARGISVVAAAGNDGANACDYTPGRMPEAITVAASEISDGAASYSNFGACVDLYAPGTDVISASNLLGGTATMSGTSMSAPHVAGAAALYLAGNPGASPAQVAAALVGRSSTNSLFAVPGGTPNRLLYTGR